MMRLFGMSVKRIFPLRSITGPSVKRKPDATFSTIAPLGTSLVSSCPCGETRGCPHGAKAQRTTKAFRNESGFIAMTVFTTVTLLRKQLPANATSPQRHLWQPYARETPRDSSRLRVFVVD